MTINKLPVLSVIIAVVCSMALAQTSTKGIITGRVVSDEGTPLMGLTIRLFAPNASRAGDYRSTSTDDEGNFRFNDLSPRAYSIEVLDGRAYVIAPKSAAERAKGSSVRVGETITLTMIRGGVITGHVTNASGENLIAMPMSAIKVRDAEGNPITPINNYRQTATDDRGIYRFYGLAPGAYLVMANYGNPYFGSQASLYDNEAPTYYPASTRDTATEIRVTSGGEITGVDIRYRGERGHAISGKLTGMTGAGNVYLLHVGSESIINSAYMSPGDKGFDFYGVLDGEYELQAESTGNDAPVTSAPRRVSVRGADVTGIDLRLMPMASLSGTVVIESAATACDKSARSLLEEMLITARPDLKPRIETDPVSRPTAVEAALNAKGEFELRRLHPVRYRLALNLPNASLFVKSIAQKAPTTDLARNGAILKSGDTLSGVIVTLAEGAASLRGKVSPQKEGVSLPPRVRIHLIPAEPNASDDVLRYAETIATSDGAFTFANRAPGKYWLLAKPVAETELSDHAPSAIAWDTAERVKLRKEAETAKHEIELKACQRLADYELRF